MTSVEKNIEQGTEKFTLYDMRQISGIKATIISEVCDINYRSLRNWETGAAIPNIVNVMKLLSLYGFTLEQLDVSQFQAINGEQINKQKEKYREFIEQERMTNQLSAHQ